MPCKDYGICRDKHTLSKPGLGQGHETKKDMSMLFTIEVSWEI
jgi:hypothetical protein